MAYQLLRRYRVAICALASIVAIIAIAACSSAVVRDQLRLSFTRKPASFAELFFVEERIHVTSAGDGSQRLAVAFAIVNQSSAAAEYQYRIAALDRLRAPVSVVGGSVAVSQGRSVLVDDAVEVPALAPWAAIEVSLVGRVEEIRLLRSNEGRG